MAGASSGWVKVPKKKHPKGKMFVSLEAVKARYGKDLTNAEAQAELRNAVNYHIDAIMSMATASKQPGGQAKGALPSVPSGWADDADAQALIEQQSARGSMMRAGTPAEKAFNAAFRSINADGTLPVSPYITQQQQDDGYNQHDGYDQLQSYTGSNYGDGFNTPLWDTAMDPITRSMPVDAIWIKKLQDLALSMQSPFDMTVTRSVNSEHALARWAKSVAVGDSYINKGFDSSSLNPDVSVFGNDVQMRMLIPKGARGLSVNAIFDLKDKEQEWLVPANSSWVVTGKRMTPEGKIEVVVQLVDQRDFDGKVIWP